MKPFSIIRILSAAALLALALGCSDEKTPVEPTIDTEPGTDASFTSLKLISYNILEGMKMDRPNNFDNFVAWVNAEAPDILALGETNQFTEATLAVLAKRWGHDHVVLCKEWGYPVSLTSKYPIELVNRMLDDTPLHHGALHMKVEGINIVALHLYPFSTYPKDQGASGTGNTYRTQEVNYILDQTIRKYPTESNWMMVGDFNSHSPLDKEKLGKDYYYGTQEAVLGSGYYDAIRQMHNYFISSTHSDSRIDFIYSSKSINRNITSADILKDKFTEEASDHYPLRITFRHYNNK